jgi:hypothetical protein
MALVELLERGYTGQTCPTMRGDPRGGQATRISQQMEAEGLEPIGADVGGLSQQVYKLLSKAAHHQRSIVDEGVDHENPHDGVRARSESR